MKALTQQNQFIKQNTLKYSEGNNLFSWFLKAADSWEVCTYSQKVEMIKAKTHFHDVYMHVYASVCICMC